MKTEQIEQQQQLTKAQQRTLVNTRGRSRLGANAIAILKELITLNHSGKNDRNADVEGKPFTTSIALIAARTGLDEDTVRRNIHGPLTDEGLVSVTVNAGKKHEYALYISRMLEWETNKEAAERQRQERRRHNADAMSKARAAKADVTVRIVADFTAKQESAVSRAWAAGVIAGYQMETAC